MGILRHDGSQRLVALASDQVVGRSESTDLTVEDPRASAQHARIRWVGDAWEIRDLGSRNGTWVDGQRVDSCRLASNAAVSFGGLDDPWTLVDAEPPCAFLQPLDGGEPRLANGDVLAPGTEAAPHVMIHRRRNDVWFLDDGDSERALRDREILTFDGQRFTFRTAATADETRENESTPPRIDEVSLVFNVSKDEEHVEIAIVHPRGVINVPPRRSAYVLLTLARHRLEDREHGDIPEADQGWAYTNDVVRELAYDTEQRLNLDIFRIREQVAGLGVEDAHDIVERRKSTAQLRIGVADLHVEGK